MAPPAVRPRTAHPVGYLLGQRTALGVFTLFVVSVLVFLATQVLPGNAAIAVLGRTAAGNPAAVHRLEVALVRSVAQSVVVLRRGVVVEAGPAEQILARPGSQYTATLGCWRPREIPFELLLAAVAGHGLVQISE